MSAKSQQRRLARKYPRKPKDLTGGLDWSGGANQDPIKALHDAVENSFLPISTRITSR
jgi:hypothetical protein